MRKINILMPVLFNVIFCSAQVNITFTGETGPIINKYLFGVNVSANVPRLNNESKTPTYPTSGNPNDPWSVDETFKPQYFPATLIDIGASFMRYPGGHKTSYWHWDDIWYNPYEDLWGAYPDGGLSTRVSREHLYDGNMDIDEYMKQCIKLNMEPVIGCNLLAGALFGKYSTRAPEQYNNLPYKGDPVEETVALLKYCKRKYPSKPINYIFLDNEVGHKIADGTIKSSHVSYTQYPQMVQDCSVAFKAESPNVKIITNFIDMPNSSNTTSLIEKKGQYIDLVDTHLYYSTGDWLEYSRSAWMMETADNLGGFPKKIRKFYATCEALGHSNIKLAVNEWNLPCIGPLRTDPVTGKKNYGATDFDQMLVLTDMLMMFIREKVEMASLWPLYYNSNKSSMIIPQEDYNVRTPCLVMKLFKEIQGQTTQIFTSNAKDMLVISAFQKPQNTSRNVSPKLILLLLSKNTSTYRSVSIDLGTLKPKSVKGFSYVEDKLVDEQYKTKILKPTISNSKIIVDCSGLSVSKLTIDIDVANK